MELGYLQKKIIEIGKMKGYITSDEVKAFYSRRIDVEMNKLIALGYFDFAEDCGAYIKWKFKNGN